ncbi:hypothetical protein LV779_34205 [Streptomyces thinghirensis]|nr:hypothetical protein [Streptomyces thinghirensis]
MAAWDADGAPDLYCYGLTATEHQQYAWPLGHDLLAAPCGLERGRHLGPPAPAAAERAGPSTVDARVAQGRAA